jgi:CRP-like cAMP-binding protein
VVASSLPLPNPSSQPAVGPVRRTVPTVATRSFNFQRSALFQGLTPGEFETLMARARERRFLENDTLSRQGQAHNEISILESGCVKLTHLLANGHEFILSLRTPFEVLDPSAVSHAEHRTTAQAMHAGRMLSWSLSTLESFPSYPQLRKNLQTLIMKDLTDLESRYCQLSTCRVDRRLACTLVSLAQRIGTEADNSGIRVHISRQELAQMVGTSLFSVCRLIARWGELGLVSPCRESIIVLKQTQLLNLTAEHDTEIC